jgi:outer membrane protein assembly factor BamB
MPWRLALSLALLLVAPAAAEDWPQWLGPRRDGSTTQKVAPWKGELKILWRARVGEGHSSPVVASGKVFLHTKVKDKEEEDLAAYDAETGKILWQTAYPREKFASPFGAGPQATPAVAGGRVYTYGATAILTCFDPEAGKQLWQVDALKKFAGKNLFFGAACSPLVEGGKAFVNVGAPGASIVAFSAQNGDVAWKALDDPASYSSPSSFEQGKYRQVVFLTGAGLASLRPDDGTVYWQFPLKDKLMESSTTPIRAGNRLIASSITYGSVALDLLTRDDKPAVKEAWKNPELTSYFTTPVVVGENDLYLVTGSNPLAFTKAQATLHSIDLKTGKKRWSKPGVGEYHAALLRTGDNNLLMMEEGGTLVLLAADPSSYRELARAKVCGHAWAHPAVANGRLYIRDDKELVCVELPQ